MKHFKFLTVALAVFLLATSQLQAQPNRQGKLMSEKIAFITMELNLSPEEAQVFWPVYNEVSQRKQKSQAVVKATYKALCEAFKAEDVPNNEINKLLDNYLAAKQAHRDCTTDDAEKYRKVLSAKKVAKLYVAEEKFRRQRINSMKAPQGGHQGRPYGGGRPDMTR